MRCAWSFCLSKLTLTKWSPLLLSSQNTAVVVPPQPRNDRLHSLLCDQPMPHNHYVVGHCVLYKRALMLLQSPIQVVSSCSSLTFCHFPYLFLFRARCSDDESKSIHYRLFNAFLICINPAFLAFSSHKHHHDFSFLQNLYPYSFCDFHRSRSCGSYAIRSRGESHHLDSGFSAMHYQ